MARALLGVGSGISSMLASAQLRARFGAQLGLSSGCGFAWLRAQLRSLGSAKCLGSTLGSARLESPVRLEVWGSAQDSVLGLDRSPA